MDGRRSRRARAGDRARAPAQPGDGVVALRFLPRGRAAATIADEAAHGHAGPENAAAAIRRPTRTRRASGCAFAMKLQQYTGPVQAKGLEDTAFYRYNVLLSLNEVGGDPSRFGRSVDEFHEANQRRAARVAVRNAGDRDARHQARRRRPRAHQRAVGDAGRVGPRGRRAGCGSTRRSARWSTASRRRTGTTSTASIRRWSASGRPTLGRRRDPGAGRPGRAPVRNT